MEQSLVELLQRCTVKLSIPGQMGHGTGFFIAPGLILTCAHVVKEADGKPIQVSWHSQSAFAVATIEQSFSEFDIALLSFTPPPHSQLPCVYLDKAIEPGDELYIFGYPDVDFPNGCPVTFTCEGLTGDDPPLLKFKLGQVRPGMSGSPLLNQRTGKVCGIVKFTRDRSIDLGGGGVPISVIFHQLPELVRHNRKFHQQDRRWTSLVPHTSSSTPLNRQEFRNRRDLLARVKNEIDGRLEQSLHNAVLINLAKEKQPQQVQRSWDVEVKVGNQPSMLLPDGTKIIEVFDAEAIAGKLLILGAPGSGKTTTMLELARELIARADDPSEPIPVLFNLSSWKDDKQTIAQWLVAELKDKYGFNIAIGSNWLLERQLLPFLDGLDELESTRQEKCVQAINQFLVSEERSLFLVVCSRYEEYKLYNTQLQLNEAIYLQPLNEIRIHKYLEEAGQPELWLSIQNDAQLLQLAKFPLLLSMMTVAYTAKSPLVWQKFNSTQERCQCLFNIYIEQMLNRPIKHQWYTQVKEPKRERTQQWLIWLAQQLQNQNQTEFLIEKMQPDWLEPFYLKIYQFALKLIVIIMFSLIAFLFLAKEELLVARILGVIGGSIAVSLFTFKDLYKRIEPVETFKLPQVKFYKLLLGYSIGILILGSTIGLNTQLIGRVIWGIIFSSILLLSLGFTSYKLETEERKEPNQVIFYSARIAGLFTVIGCLGLALTISLTQTITFPVLSNRDMLVSGAMVVPTLALLTGGLACLQHLLLRLMLWWTGYIPWDYARFLNYATERMILQRVGGRYRFIHRLLQEHFTQM